eukprot:1158927-Pelagomonas_calceolata.AAC.11
MHAGRRARKSRQQQWRSVISAHATAPSCSQVALPAKGSRGNAAAANAATANGEAGEAPPTAIGSARGKGLSPDLVQELESLR